MTNSVFFNAMMLFLCCVYSYLVVLGVGDSVPNSEISSAEFDLLLKKIEMLRNETWYYEWPTWDNYESYERTKRSEDAERTGMESHDFIGEVNDFVDDRAGIAHGIYTFLSIPSFLGGLGLIDEQIQHIFDFFTIIKLQFFHRKLNRIPSSVRRVERIMNHTAEIIEERIIPDLTLIKENEEKIHYLTEELGPLIAANGDFINQLLALRHEQEQLNKIFTDAANGADYNCGQKADSN